VQILRIQQWDEIVKQWFGLPSKLCGDEACCPLDPGIPAAQERTKRLDRQPSEVFLEKIVRSASFVKSLRVVEQLANEELTFTRSHH
jgi:hypothetical protein